MLSQSIMDRINNHSTTALNIYSTRNKTYIDIQELFGKEDRFDVYISEDKAQEFREDINKYINENWGKNTELDFINLHVSPQSLYMTIMSDNDILGVTTRICIDGYNCTRRYTIAVDIGTGRQKRNILKEDYASGLIEILAKHLPILETHIFIETLSKINYGLSNES